MPTDKDIFNRRLFLQCLGGLAIASTIPISHSEIVSRWESSGVIAREIFYLDETLELYLPDHFLISYCNFIATSKLGKRPLLDIKTGRQGLITNCIFDGNVDTETAILLSARMISGENRD